MTWPQTYAPLGSVWVSALVAALPVVVLLMTCAVVLVLPASVVGV